MKAQSRFRWPIWRAVGAVALVPLGYWLVPDEPALPAFVLMVVAASIALVGIAYLIVNERHEAARARAADATYYYGEGDAPSSEETPPPKDYDQA